MLVFNKLLWIAETWECRKAKEKRRKSIHANSGAEGLWEQGMGKVTEKGSRSYCFQKNDWGWKWSSEKQKRKEEKIKGKTIINQKRLHSPFRHY